MAAPRRVVELEIRADELARLETVARSRTEAASRVSRAHHAGLSRGAVVDRGRGAAWSDTPYGAAMPAPCRTVGGDGGA